MPIVPFFPRVAALLLACLIALPGAAATGDGSDLAAVADSAPLQPAAADDATGQPEAADALAGPGPFPAANHELSEFLWTRRVLAVFADTPNDPAYRRQLEMIAERLDALDERDVIVLTDTAPKDATPLRRQLRPRGFTVVIVDKDGRVLQRRPSPWGVREITRLIDSTPLRRQQEMGG